MRNPQHGETTKVVRWFNGGKHGHRVGRTGECCVACGLHFRSLWESRRFTCTFWKLRTS
jgi:hypothetical protein